jgi:hypothetical protein
MPSISGQYERISSMTLFTGPGGSRRKGMFAAALLATTVLAGGGLALAETDNNAQTAPTTAPLGLAPVVNQAGFADLAAKVGPAVVNIATTEGGGGDASPGPQGHMPFPPNSPM